MRWLDLRLRKTSLAAIWAGGDQGRKSLWGTFLPCNKPSVNSYRIDVGEDWMCVGKMVGDRGQGHRCQRWLPELSAWVGGEAVHQVNDHEMKSFREWTLKICPRELRVVEDGDKLVRHISSHPSGTRVPASLPSFHVTHCSGEDNTNLKLFTPYP